MTKTSFLLFSLMLATTAHAGVAGWLTSSARDWAFVQETGGIRICEPFEKGGKLVLPVECDVTGSSGVTCRPTGLNSGLAVRKVEITSAGKDRIVIRIVTQVAEQNSDSGRMHYANLQDLPSGAYTVYYEDADDPAKLLGRIRVK